MKDDFGASSQHVVSCAANQGVAMERSKSLKTDQHDTAYLRQRRLLESSFGILGNLASPEESGSPPSCMARISKLVSVLGCQDLVTQPVGETDSI